MGLARVRKPEGLVSREARSEARPENAIRKCDSNRRDSQVRSTSTIQNTINRCDSQVRSTGATHKCDRQVRLTSAIDRCDSQVRSTGATHKCDRLNRESPLLSLVKYFAIWCRGLCHNSVIVWDPSTKRWRNGPSLYDRRSDLVAVVCFDEVYAIGGSGGDNNNYTTFDTIESIQVSSLLETMKTLMTTRQNNSHWTKGCNVACHLHDLILPQLSYRTATLSF